LIHGELGQVVLGEIPGRDTDDEITLFKSVGNAIQDLALANLIMEKINHDSN
jgi:ornithine cyclodeaminase/alanine dehydrogenase-like protein (mu-crystallin family)